MFILGLTGQSGAGKGTVAKVLTEYGFLHIDTDKLSREVIPEALSDLVNEFGKEILNEDGSLNRQSLAERAFENNGKTEKLNIIMHKRIMQKVNDIIKSYENKGGKYVTVDGAALFEAGAEKICDKVLLVVSPWEVRLNRVLTRDKINEDQALNRFKRQKSVEYYKEKSDYIIENNENDNFDSINKKVYALLNENLKLLNNYIRKDDKNE
ncbi:MAG: dephospho-CoA kinase [Clostridia bacterium]|nr:dephospho-CoA kinase [Clostridia bacterium]